MVDAILSIIGMILYPLFSIIFVILAIVQLIFKAFAGTGSIGISGAGGGAGAVRDLVTGANDGTDTGSGIVYYLLTRPLVQNLIMSIMLLALFLIIIFTVMAFIKNAYASKQKTWQEIIGNAFKGLAGFIFIPVCCLLGAWAGNILLNAIDGATSLGGSVELEKKLFIACAYNANHIRNNTDKYKKLDENGKTKAYNLCVELLDDAVGVTGDKLDIQLEERGTSNADMEYYASIVDTIYSQADYSKSTDINIYWYGSTGRGYALWNVNYLVLLVVGIFMIGVMLNLAYGMIKRLFWLAMLFVISPALCALYPIDEGSAVGGYKKEFIKHTISAYAAVAGMNLFMSLLPFIEGISLTRAMTSSSSGLSLVGSVDLYVQLIVMVSGLYVVKEFISTLAGWIGGGNALADGESLKKSVNDSISKKVKGGVKVASTAFGAANSKEGFWSKTGAVFGSLAGQSFDGIKKASGYEDLAKTAKESFEAGEKKVVDDYNKDRTDTAYSAARPAVNAAIGTARAAGRKMTDEEMATVLDGITDKGAKEKAAEEMARYNNAVAMRTNTGTTTKEKVLESPEKVEREEGVRQDSFQSQLGYNEARTDEITANTEFSTYRSANNGKYGLTLNNDGTVTGAPTQEDIANLETAANSVGATDADKQALAEAKAAIEIAKEHKELYEKRKAARAQVKTAALGLADNIMKLADNYSGADKNNMKTIATTLKTSVNAPGATTTMMRTAVNTARTSLGAIRGGEIIRILNTGSR